MDTKQLVRHAFVCGMGTMLGLVFAYQGDYLMSVILIGLSLIVLLLSTLNEW